MPSLFRFLFVLGVLAALAYGAMLALVVFVKPEPRPMTVTIPADRLNPVRITVPTAEPAEADGSGDTEAEAAQ
ncbi:MAG: histidine kinase [Roseitalea sp.]|jgi:hypothetical protein|uniref:histidine kinase n=1 Tax=Oceaniradius stylonematis TaxID=2184161 RepID=UPI0018C88EA9|nr:histidine kinase [Oceaniradius stylonematis]MBO6554032.1 histidine kinase [Roseitalea sp.]MBO6952844.1 histidine kinase [Rhizobiaceae bacterium]MBO6593191.1 histidine kinase [Roseitalea sp.]MBO6600819.1 histidine kinase [Roseitalea sp.]MBO6612500.1 histidine kinase [Roseitalea sp.]